MADDVGPLPLLKRVASQLRRSRMAVVAGLILICAGTVCLYLSDAVVRAGSWSQGTLDAFGVGLVIGGVVDVLAVPMLNDAIQRRDKELTTALDRRIPEVLAEALAEARARAVLDQSGETAGVGVQD